MITGLSLVDEEKLLSGAKLNQRFLAFHESVTTDIHPNSMED